MVWQTIALTMLVVGVATVSYWAGRTIALNQIKKYLQKHLIVDRFPGPIKNPPKPRLYVFNGGKKSEDRTSK